jgi:hypothetical protein
MKRLLCLGLLPWLSCATNAVVVSSRPHNGSASLCPSAINGMDCDQLTWDMFRAANGVSVVGANPETATSPLIGRGFFRLAHA